MLRQDTYSVSIQRCPEPSSIPNSKCSEGEMRCIFSGVGNKDHLSSHVHWFSNLYAGSKHCKFAFAMNSSSMNAPNAWARWRGSRAVQRS
jgi:hypothetical protein